METQKHTPAGDAHLIAAAGPELLAALEGNDTALHMLLLFDRLINEGNSDAAGKVWAQIRAAIAEARGTVYREMEG